MMCAAAISEARIKKVFFGAYDNKKGAYHNNNITSIFIIQKIKVEEIQFYVSIFESVDLKVSLRALKILLKRQIYYVSVYHKDMRIFYLTLLHINNMKNKNVRSKIIKMPRMPRRI